MSDVPKSATVPCLSSLRRERDDAIRRWSATSAATVATYYYGADSSIASHRSRSAVHTLPRLDTQAGASATVHAGSDEQRDSSDSAISLPIFYTPSLISPNAIQSVQVPSDGSSEARCFVYGHLPDFPQTVAGSSTGSYSPSCQSDPLEALRGAASFDTNRSDPSDQPQRYSGYSSCSSLAPSPAESAQSLLDALAETPRRTARHPLTPRRPARNERDETPRRVPALIVSSASPAQTIISSHELQDVIDRTVHATNEYVADARFAHGISTDTCSTSTFTDSSSARLLIQSPPTKPRPATSPASEPKTSPFEHRPRRHSSAQEPSSPTCDRQSKHYDKSVYSGPSFLDLPADAPEFITLLIDQEGFREVSIRLRVSAIDPVSELIAYAASTEAGYPYHHGAFQNPPALRRVCRDSDLARDFLGRNASLAIRTAGTFAVEGVEKKLPWRFVYCVRDRLSLLGQPVRREKASWVTN
ncbi:uncharacterized protein L969DRAFT_17742 [Mixia osmundae IAM 14324]|uniref:Uncharacterized protein n=1 Tax=Mixia osmundae (strain CBS 9802 / IAM 14324 / JCM 22182 / KY 12970) TaxID=764103 RepID=G7E1W6_MIXOS|nr:uncharacterized protein L969DRAFT_17742 [Mixia osmundae IAM 14324]KEI38664.1 hypothetical protein L969DRAFT_17742 [Mixia osmundae IAM 14324]GAA96879.1 hypothetical protein E5Q_03552 [Mixia osmundae IAM 14324]